MNTLRNRVQLIGNLGQDPELKTLESGKKVVNFTLATFGFAGTIADAVQFLKNPITLVLL